MIQSIQINNFLSHKKTDLVFSAGVNIIVGESDTGKSAIIRALRWVLFNRPVGDDFRSTWGGDTSVEVLTELNSVTRRKSDKENQYIILPRTKKGKRQVFNAVKSEVPEEVTTILNMNEVNLLAQFDSHFLLSSSPGEVAKHFNKVAHLDKIDSSIAFLTKEQKLINSSIITYEGLLNEDLLEFEKYNIIKPLEKVVASLLKDESRLQELSNPIKGLMRLLDSLALINKEINETDFIFEMELLVDKALSYYTSILLLREDIVHISSLVSTLNSLEEQKAGLMRFFDLETLVDKCLNLKTIEKDFTSRLVGLIDFLEKVGQVEFSIKQGEAFIKEKEGLFIKLIGKECPLCGSKI